MIKAIDATTLRKQDGGRMRGQRIDVRSASEYATGHIPGALNIPMEQIEARLDDLAADAPVVLICQRGTRAQMTARFLEPCGIDLAVLEGGTEAWTDAGFPVVASVGARWSLERQVRLGAGLLVLLAVGLVLRVHSSWIYLAGLVGAGLTFAGFTNFCPMAVALGALPWNRAPRCPISALSSSPDKHTVAGV